MIAFRPKMNNGSDSFSIEKGKDGNQIKIKMGAKQLNKIHYVEDFLNHEIELTNSHSIESPKKMEKYHFSATISKGHFMMSSFVSLTILLHAIYWEYAARSMKGFHHKWSHLQISFAFSVLNFLPSFSIWLNMYSSFLSIAVIIHSIWLIYHVFGSWVHDICSYNAFTEMCIAVTMYKNVTLCLIAIVVFHQWLILLTNFRKYANDHYENKIQTALEKAENLDIEEINDNDIEETEIFDGHTDLETPAIDVSLETPNQADIESVKHKLDLEELEQRFKHFNDHSHTNNGCKYCFWDHENPSLSNHGTSESDMDLRIVVPKSTKKHAIPMLSQ